MYGVFFPCSNLSDFKAVFEGPGTKSIVLGLLVE